MLYSGANFEASQGEGLVNPLTSNRVHRLQLGQNEERAPAMRPPEVPHTKLQSQTTGKIWMSHHHDRDRGPRIARLIL